MKILHLAFAGAMALASFTGTAFAQSADNFLTITLKDGPVVVELRPDIAPKHVEQIKALAAAGEYDNVAFHRVIKGFMAQTGDPLGTGDGQSWYPDLKAEFTFRRGPEMMFNPVAAPRQQQKRAFRDVDAHPARAARLGVVEGPVLIDPVPLRRRGAAGRHATALAGFDGDVLVLSGDVPLLDADTLLTLVRDHRASRAAVTSSGASAGAPPVLARAHESSMDTIQR